VPSGTTNATDAPGMPLPSIYSSATRNFNASMYLMWQSGGANSIPIPLGYVTWEFTGNGSQSNGTWTPGGSGSNSSFFPITPSQTSPGFPTWQNVSTEGSC
jgi:hypothetical protein